MPLQTKLIGCANSVAKSVAVRGELGVVGGVHEIKEEVTLETERTAIIYIYIYIYIYINMDVNVT